MNISDDFMSPISGNSLYAFPDNSRTQMSHMERFCHIRSAIINDNLLSYRRLFQPKFRTFLHFPYIVCKKGFLHFQIDKSRRHRIRTGKYYAFLQFLCHIICYYNRCLFIFFGTRHGTVTLIFTQVRPVGNSHPSQLFFITGSIKRRFYLF